MLRDKLPLQLLFCTLKIDLDHSYDASSVNLLLGWQVVFRGFFLLCGWYNNNDIQACPESQKGLKTRIHGFDCL